MIDVKENKVLAVIIENFNFEYDESIPGVVTVFHNNEEVKNPVDTIETEYTPSLQGLKELALKWYRNQPFYLIRERGY